ncbi:replication initiation protein (plasmid) [Burkholderia vietnamiensis]|uniref:Initiator RepB protein n=1 Tax=Burkholderia vietnamiensis (strain G4 / LMG 22486) TaxID=269482 RepID=A4JWE3_BURVG|nr:initiator RepB protein [Burkholderia vietnamiensis G4]MCB4349771.1 replication initiation protein [Burkholderia vietnamiensis]
MGKVIKSKASAVDTRSPELAKLDERELRKHVATIHVSGSLSLVERKIVNVLLLHAYDDLLTKREHTMSVRFLCEAIGWDSSNDHKKLAEAAENIMRNIVTVNMFSDGSEEWKKTALVSSVGVKNGRVTYAYIEWLAERLARPEVFAAIDIKIQRRFKSGYALALYENCIRFKGVGQTRYAPVDTWKEILGATGKMYEEYRHFSNHVLKTAIKEINDVADIDVDLRVKKDGRRIVEIQFGVKEKAQAELPFEGDPKEEQTREELQRIGIGANTIKRILAKNPSRAWLAAKVTRERETAGKIKDSAAGYFMSIFESDSVLELPAEPPKPEQKEPARPSAEELEKDRKADAARKATAALTEEKRAELRAAYIANNPDAAYNEETGRWNKAAHTTGYRAFERAQSV